MNRSVGLWAVVCAVLLLGGLNGCSCSKPTPVDTQCPDPLAGPYDDLFTGSGTQTVFTKTIDDAADLIGGPYAQGQLGDTLVYNDQVRFIIEGIGDPIANIGQYGGNIIDADIQRGSDPGQDHFGELIPIIHLGKTMYPDTIEVTRDGSDGGPVMVKVCGGDETIDFFNLEALAGGFGITLAWDVLADDEVRISNTYVLPPNSNRVYVATTVGNPKGQPFYTVLGDVVHTGSTQETFINNGTGWGEGGLDAALAAQPPTRFQVWASPEVTYGLVPSTDPSISLDVSGINAMAYGFANAFAIFSSSPDPEAAGVVTVPKKKTYTVWRTFVIGDGGGAEAVTDAYHELAGVPDTVARSGVVTEDDGTTPIAGARVTLIDSDRYPVVSFTSQADGTYGGLVPAGTYTVVADVEGRGIPTFDSGTATTITTRYDENDIDGVEITLDATSTALPNIQVPQASTLDFTVTDITVGGVGNGTAMPAKVAIVGADPTPPDSMFRDNRKDSPPGGIFRIAHIGATGTLSVPIEPGTFDVYVSRGPEYSAFTQQVVVTPGQTIPIAVELERVANTDGWISIDSHIHMENSPDSRVTKNRRVISAAVENVEVLITTDHDFVTDLAPYVTALNLEPFLGSVVGEEITSWDYGHFNMFPLTADPTSRTGGSFDWMGGLGSTNNLTVAEIFEGADQQHPGTQVRQINHPRGGATFQSYFDAIGLDTLTLESKTPAEDKRIHDIPGATAQDTLLFTDTFNAMEVLNGTGQQLDVPRTNALVNDWFTFLSHGLTVTGVGVSDTHSQLEDQVGWARSYVFVGAGNDTPGNIDDETLATAINDGHVTFGYGPLLGVVVDDGAAGTAIPGDTLLNANGALNLTVTGDFPTWMEIDTLQVFANTPDTVAPFDAQNQVAPTPVCEIAVTPTLSTTGNGTDYLAVNEAVDLAAGACDIGTADAWVVVHLFGSDAAAETFPYVHQVGGKADVWGNAIYVDRDADGAYTASGPIITNAFVPATPQPLPQVDLLDLAGKELSAEQLEDVRAVFHSVQCSE